LQGAIQGAAQAITQSLIQIGGSLLKLPLNIVGGSLNSFAELETELVTFGARSTLGREGIQPIADEIQRLGQESTKTSVEVAQAANSLLQLGASPADVQKQLAGVVGLSEATGTGLVEAAEISTAAAALFGFSADEISDRLASLAITSAAEVSDVQQVLQQAGLTFAQIGGDPDELLAAFATLRDAKVNPEVAATGLRSVGETLTDPKKADELKELGVNAFDAEGKFLGLTTVFKQLKVAEGQFNPQEFTGKIIAAFGAGGLNAILGNLKLLDSNYKTTLDGLKNSTGKASGITKELQKGLPSAIEQFGGSLNTLDVAFGKSIAPIQEGILRLGTTLLNALSESDIFDQLTTASNGFLEALQSNEGFVAELGKTLVATFGSVLNAIASVVTRITNEFIANPEEILARVQGFVTQAGVVITNAILGAGAAFQFIVNNFDEIILAAQGLAVAIGAAITGNVVGNIITLGQGFVDLGTKLVEFAKIAVPVIAGAFAFIGTNLSGLLLAFQAGGIAGVVSSLGATFSLFAASLAPLLPIIAAVAGAIALIVIAFKALRSERGQEILSAIGAKAKELFDSFRNSEPVKAFLNLLDSIRDLGVALIPVIKNVVGEMIRFGGVGIENIKSAFASTGISVNDIYKTLLLINPIAAGTIALAKTLLSIVTDILNKTATAIDNLTAAIGGPKTNKGVGLDIVGDNLREGTNALVTGVKNAADAAKPPAATPAEKPTEKPTETPAETPAGPKRDLAAEQKAAADALAAAEKKAEDDKNARQTAFDDARIARDIAAEDAKLARQQAFEDTKRANALAFESEIESRKLATEQAIEAIKEEGRIREEKFNEQQRIEEEKFNEQQRIKEQAFNESQNEAKELFDENQEKRKTKAERDFALSEANNSLERASLRREFKEEDELQKRRDKFFGPIEADQKAFETQQKEEQKLFAEQLREDEKLFAAQQREDEIIFAEQQRALDAEAELLKAESEKEINRLNLEAKNQEIALERDFQNNEREIERRFKEGERDAEAAFNADQRRLDEESARRIEALKSGNDAAAVTAFRRGGTFAAGQNILAGEAGPELLKVGGKQALVTEPSLMRFDSPGRVTSAPSTRRKLSQGQLSRAGAGGELKAMRKALERSLSRPPADINTTVQVQGLSADQVRRQLAMHQSDLYRSLGGL
jgi:TP901 family phage tail tape measure protein